MPDSESSASDSKIILQCMKCLLESEYIDSNEMKSRMGLSKEELKAKIIHWPNQPITISDALYQVAINNSLNEVSNGISINDSEWHSWFSCTRKDVESVYSRWAKQRSITSKG